MAKINYPYAAIEHRVIDSPAYADLMNSSCRLLTLLTRQIGKVNNNGHLHASFDWCEERGIGSKHTLANAIADLIVHGFIYRTRSHGSNGVWAKYALTWLPVKDEKGIYLDGFVADAWTNWQPSQKKKLVAETAPRSGRNCTSNPERVAETALLQVAETATYELSTPVVVNPQVIHSTNQQAEQGGKRSHQSSEVRLRKLSILEYLFTVGVQKSIQKQNHRWAH